MIPGNSSVVIKTSPAVSSTSVTNKLWTMVMDKVTDMIDYVMAESIASDKCDGCDGIFKKSSEKDDNVEIKADCNTVNEGQLEKTDLVEEFWKMPSPSSQNKAESQMGLEVTDTLVEPSPAINSPITVGDRVTIDDCPGHWSWCSPFTVEAIEGEMVKLEMIEEMVEMDRLESFIGLTR